MAWCKVFGFALVGLVLAATPARADNETYDANSPSTGPASGEVKGAGTWQRPAGGFNAPGVMGSAVAPDGTTTDFPVTVAAQQGTDKGTFKFDIQGLQPRQTYQLILRFTYVQSGPPFATVIKTKTVNWFVGF